MNAHRRETSFCLGFFTGSSTKCTGFTPGCEVGAASPLCLAALSVTSSGAVARGRFTRVFPTPVQPQRQASVLRRLI